MRPHDVIGHVIIRLPGAEFLWVVQGDYASILHHYGDMAPQILDARTWTQEERRKNEKRKRKAEGKGREMESGKEKGRERGNRKGMESKGTVSYTHLTLPTNREV